MTSPRNVVARCVISGTLGPIAAPVEIWATGFWIAAYAPSGDIDPDPNMGSFNPESYIDNHAKPLADAIMSNAQSFVAMTEIKCNLFGISEGSGKSAGRYGVHQLSSTTVGKSYTPVAGVGNYTVVPYTTAFGWALTNSTQRRGIATHGRMFLPPQGSTNNSFTALSDAGHWAGNVVTAVDSVMHAAWVNLQAASDGGNIVTLPSGNQYTYLPSLVSVPKTITASTVFQVNAADVTTAEATLWTMRSRKNKIKPQGAPTTYPTFR